MSTAKMPFRSLQKSLSGSRTAMTTSQPRNRSFPIRKCGASQPPNPMNPATCTQRSLSSHRKPSQKTPARHRQLQTKYISCPHTPIFQAPSHLVCCFKWEHLGVLPEIVDAAEIRKKRKTDDCSGKGWEHDVFPRPAAPSVGNGLWVPFCPNFLAESFSFCFCCLIDDVAIELGGSSNPLVAKLGTFLSSPFGRPSFVG